MNLLKRVSSDCQKVQQYFTHLQTAETNILSAISSLNTLKGLTSDATILSFVTNTQTVLNRQYLEIHATMTSLETSCDVTRPVQTAQTTATYKVVTASTKAMTTHIQFNPKTIAPTTNPTTTVSGTSAATKSSGISLGIFTQKFEKSFMKYL